MNVEVQRKTTTKKQKKEFLPCCNQRFDNEEDEIGVQNFSDNYFNAIRNRLCL